MTTLNKDIVVTLLNLAQADQHASVHVLAEKLGLSRAEIATSLNELALEGLIRPETIRLTFVGLMFASGMRARHEVEKKGKSGEAAELAA